MEGNSEAGGHTAAAAGRETARATRRRGAALEQAILDAAVEELAEVGYQNLTMDGVAARAATSKNVIYRRWPNRAALCVAAYLRMLPTDPEDTPDTGDLRSDSLALLHRVNNRMSSRLGKILRALLADFEDDPERVSALREQLGGASVGPWLTMLARAAARGEVGSAALTPRVATVAVDLLRNEYALNGLAPVPDSTLVEIVDQVYLPLVRGLS
ncbi:TetR/AcrR family transcriptional regulator [Streptomyces chartreusis]|uniref:TetR/AcrR family transcriptional regulator n=1 Tax=Streptomyces chartreusis TaxID=1969 RepID=UPI0033B94252